VEFDALVFETSVQVQQRLTGVKMRFLIEVQSFSESMQIRL
jgi:hypothetical protein